MEAMTKETFGDRLLERASDIVAVKNSDGTYHVILHGGGDEEHWSFNIFRAKIKITDILAQSPKEDAFLYEGYGRNCSMKNALGEDVPVTTTWKWGE